MQINNPFESGHIKNYLLLYASIVVIMILFFIASTLFNDVKTIDKKVFETKALEKRVEEKSAREKEDDAKPSLKTRLKLMDKVY